MANKRTTIAASAARTTTTTFGPFVNRNGRTLRITIRATALSASPSVVPSILAVSPGGGTTSLLTGTAITTAAPTEQVLEVGPDLAAAANTKAQAVAPSRYSVVMTAGDADSLTYAVYAEELS
jgi:hypothetical protein